VLVRPLQTPAIVDDTVKGDVIFVLIGGNESEGMNRLLWAHRLWERLRVPIVLSGCDDKGHLKCLLINIGIPDQDILEETTSRDTYGNAKQAKKILEKRSFRRPILVTSSYHMKRAVFLFEKHEMKVIPYPCDFKVAKCEKEHEFRFLAFVPNASALEQSSKALKEYLGLLAAKVGIH